MSPLWNLKYQERKKKFADDTDYNLEERERLLYDQVCLCYLQGGQNARIFSLEIHFFLFFDSFQQIVHEKVQKISSK